MRSSTSLTIHEFHQRYQKHLQLSFASAQIGLDKEIKILTSDQESAHYVDYLNIIRPSRIVIIGEQESSFLATLKTEKQIKLLGGIIDSPIFLIILSQNARLDKTVIQFCESHSIPIFQSQLEDSVLLDNLRYFLKQALAETAVEHGVYIDVFSIGTFITGESGVGKSELALSLISLGHRLIADDITEFSRISADTIDGMHPGLSNDFMEVRGMGILNIRAMFGSNALRRNKTLRLIVNLVPFTSENSHHFDRIGDTYKTRNILGLEIPELTLPVAPGRNLAVLVEAAARNHMLNMGGYNAAEDFIERQRRAILANAKG